MSVSARSVDCVEPSRAAARRLRAKISGTTCRGANFGDDGGVTQSVTSSAFTQELLPSYSCFSCFVFAFGLFYVWFTCTVYTRGAPYPSTFIPSYRSN